MQDDSVVRILEREIKIDTKKWKVEKETVERILPESLAFLQVLKVLSSRLYFQGCLYNKQTWEIEIVLSSKAEGSPGLLPVP